VAAAALPSVIPREVKGEDNTGDNGGLERLWLWPINEAKEDVRGAGTRESGRGGGRCLVAGKEVERSVRVIMSDWLEFEGTAESMDPAADEENEEVVDSWLCEEVETQPAWAWAWWCRMVDDIG